MLTATSRRAGFFSLLALLVFFMGPFSAAAQDTHALTGTVVGSDGEPLAGATVEVEALDRGATTNADGQFRFEGLEAGSYMLETRFVGFQSRQVEVAVPEDTPVRIALEPSVFELDDAIVTASPVGETAYQPAQALNPQDLQDRSGSSFGELLDGEPGIAMRSFGPAPSRPVIRGFGGDRVLMLENGERMGDIAHTAVDHNSSLEPLAAERVEIVRGPASLLYGSSALGGVVNILTRDIPRDWQPGSSGTFALEGATMNESASGFGRYQYAGSNWAGTARLSYRGAGDMQTPEGTLPDTFINNFEGAAGLAYQGSSFEGGLSFSAVDHNFGIPEEAADPDEEAEIVMEQQTLQGRAEWSTGGFIEDIELRAHGSRLQQEEIETEFAPDGSVDEEEVEIDYDQWSGGATATFRHRPVGLLDEGAFGLNVQGLTRDVGGDEAFSPGIEEFSGALFTFQEVPLSDIWRLQFGLRGETQSFEARPNEDFPDIDAGDTSTALSGSVGLNVQPRPELEVGLQVARAHRFPILEERFADGVHFGAGVYERGDPSLGTEIGWGTDFFARWETPRLHAEIAGFYNRMSDFIAFTPTGETFTDSDGDVWDIFEYRASNAELLGGEAQLTARVTESLEVGGILDYVRGANTDASEPLPTIPPLRTTLNARYDTGRWWVGGNVRLVEDQRRVADEELPTDGYALVGLEGGLQFDAQGLHRLSLQVDNLTNASYRDHLSRIDRTEFGVPMPGRNLNLSYQYRF